MHGYTVDHWLWACVVLVFRWVVVVCICKAIFHSTITVYLFCEIKRPSCNVGKMMNHEIFVIFHSCNFPRNASCQTPKRIWLLVLPRLVIVINASLDTILDAPFHAWFRNDYKNQIYSQCYRVFIFPIHICLQCNFIRKLVTYLFIIIMHRYFGRWRLSVAIAHRPNRTCGRSMSRARVVIVVYEQLCAHTCTHVSHSELQIPQVRKR